VAISSGLTDKLLIRYFIWTFQKHVKGGSECNDQKNCSQTCQCWTHSTTTFATDIRPLQNIQNGIRFLKVSDNLKRNMETEQHHASAEPLKSQEETTQMGNNFWAHPHIGKIVPLLN
jgi:regulatory protein YycH of two-component signal transduction system YycFG